MKPLSFQTKIHIHLYERIKFQEEEIEGWNEGEPGPGIREEGYYYFGKFFFLTNYTDLTKEWESNPIFEKIDFDPSMLKDKKFVINKLVELNKKEFAKAEKEIKYWEKEQKKLAVPIPINQRKLQFYSTVITHFNEWFTRNDQSKQIKVKKQQHYMDYPSEALIYLKTAMDTYPDEPKLRELNKKSGNRISNPTWSRRRYDLSFIAAIVKLINKKIKAIVQEDDRSEKLGEIKNMLTMKIDKIKKQKKAKERKSDIYDRSRNVSDVNIENISTDTNKTYGINDSDLKYNTLPLNDYPAIGQIILN